MKKIILIISILSVFAVACGNKATGPAAGDKPLTTNVPSDDKTVREGTPLANWNGVSKSTTANYSVSANNAVNNLASGGDYNLLERLYSTTWYQSESDYDDGRLETEEEFVFFNENSEMVKREYENGRIDGRDEYSSLKHISDIVIPNAQANKDKNACIVQNTERDDYDFDTEYEGYYLVDRDTLYIVDGDTIEIVKTKLNDLISGNTQKYREDKFVLSTRALN
ncbi:hypothetical protein PQQ32_10430 [Brachyspira hyodysenteriae]|uniref:hypothetical protein n=1 Tax=Brachyspira hyodysenteriae TaxID=159 RepID=UPI0022CD6B80|nr:hypothetical protein [Brachyspira hyodysenteriae]MCZ9892817.1 hypothetical protein [Brachyspira hyodysenteriae]MCZ9990367.1 hypothetical protein [Brachyspira hyodysenteriae]MCZ9998735.1 hypothetical protein [Brachyspira hyodysenteriae]MCZ9999967.1 hypothetical protein [Brachyspira hyodysenteriae]MDA0007170.1 hypothetical protein [Brachyspira hyodysenteriae]